MIRHACLSADDALLAYLSGLRVLVRDAGSLELLHSAEPDEQSLLGGDTTGGLGIQDAAEGRRLIRVTQGGGGIASQLLVWSLGPGTGELLGAPAWRMDLTAWSRRRPYVRSVAVQRRGRLVALGGADGRVRLVDLGVRDVVQELVPGSGRAIESLEFSPEGDVLLAGDDQTLWIVAPTADRWIARELVSGDRVAHATISRTDEGLRVAYATGDGRALMVDLSGRKLAEFCDFYGERSVTARAVPSGRELLVSQSDGRLVLWSLDPERVRALAVQQWRRDLLGSEVRILDGLLGEIGLPPFDSSRWSGVRRR